VRTIVELARTYEPPRPKKATAKKKPATKRPAVKEKPARR